MSACFHHRKDLTRKKNKNHGSHCCSSSIPTVSSAVAFCVRPMTTMTPWKTTIELAMTTPTTTTDDPESRRGCLGHHWNGGRRDSIISHAWRERNGHRRDDDDDDDDDGTTTRLPRGCERYHPTHQKGGGFFFSAPTRRARRSFVLPAIPRERTSMTLPEW